MTSELFIRFKRKPARVDYAASHMQTSARMELFLPVQTSDAAEISAVDTGACQPLCVCVCVDKEQFCQVVSPRS